MLLYVQPTTASPLSKSLMKTSKPTQPCLSTSQSSNSVFIQLFSLFSSALQNRYVRIPMLMGSFFSFPFCLYWNMYHEIFSVCAFHSLQLDESKTKEKEATLSRAVSSFLFYLSWLHNKLDIN